MSETNPNTKEDRHMIQIAIPVAEGVFSEHFGGARQFVIYEGDARTRRLRNCRLLNAPEHKPGSLPQWLEQQNVDVIVASAIGGRALIMLANAGIEVLLANGDNDPLKLASAVLAGELPRATSENSRCHGHHDHDGHECHHH
jgi:predicted Fe-Mo cluster-binding NifX family protein